MKTDSKEKDLFLKLCRYCAYRERAIREVREKMTALDINEGLQKRFIAHLIAENFINEKRFSESFARGKFRNNRWGRLKISKALLAKQIHRQDIDYGLSQIEEEEYKATLIQLMHGKMRSIKNRNLLVKRKKTADFLIGKGFEPYLVWDILKAEFPG